MEEKKNSSFALKIVIFTSIAALVGVLIYSEIDRQNIRAFQDEYQKKIGLIKQLVDAGDCSEASVQYLEAKGQRDQIIKSGLYYSLESHAKQAHAIDIAECFAHIDQIEEAINILEMEEVHDPDYLSRAAVIYENAGDVAKSEELKAMAEKFDTSR